MPAVSFSGVISFVITTIIIASLIQGMCPTPVLRLFPTPIILLLIYIVVGIVAASSAVVPDFAIIASTPLEPQAIQTIFLPPLIFSELFKMNLQTFQSVFPQVLWLIGPCVVFGAFITGIFTLYLMPSAPHFSTYVSFAFGGMLATTDPISVIIALNSLGAPKRLTALVGGESLLNDGTSIIIVTIFLELASGADLSAGAIVAFCFQELLLSVVFGTAMGLFSLLLILLVRDDAVILASLSLTLPYITFIIAQYWLDTSGVLSLVPLGLLLNRFGTSVMVRHREHIEAVWDEVEFFAISVLYAMSGIFVGVDFLLGSIAATDWLSLFYLYLFLLAVRAVLIFGSFPLLTRVGYGLSLPEAVVAWWGGLRGAVGLTLAMSIRQSVGVTEREGQLTLFFMAGIVLFMVFNGVSTAWVCRKLGLIYTPNPHVVAALMNRVRSISVESMSRAGVHDHHLHLITKPSFTGSKLLQRAKSSAGGASDLIVANSGDDVERHPLTQMWVSMSLLDAKRRHVIAAQKTGYRNLLEKKLLPKRAYYLLVRAAERQLDADVIGPLNHWRFVESQIAGMTRLCLSCGNRTGKLVGMLVHAIATHSLEEFTIGPLSAVPPPWCDCGRQSYTQGVEMVLTAFVHAAWGFIVCEQHSRGLIKKMFRLDATSFFFQPEMRSLERESQASCKHPALLMDIAMTHFPDVVASIKRHHALADMHEKTHGLLSKLLRDGLCERGELKLLFKELERIEATCERLEFSVVEPHTVKQDGRGLLANPNFFPFPARGAAAAVAAVAAAAVTGSGTKLPQAERRFPAVAATSSAVSATSAAAGTVASVAAEDDDLLAGMENASSEGEESQGAQRGDEDDAATEDGGWSAEIIAQEQEAALKQQAAEVIDKVLDTTLDSPEDVLAEDELRRY